MPTMANDRRCGERTVAWFFSSVLRAAVLPKFTLVPASEEQAPFQLFHLEMYGMQEISLGIPYVDISISASRRHAVVSFAEGDCLNLSLVRTCLRAALQLAHPSAANSRKGE